jgi:hypothetical protein
MSHLLTRSVVITWMSLMSLCAASLYSLPSAAAASPVERIALQLNGSQCRSQHANILSALSPIPGVRAIDLSSVPGHALVDIDTAALSAQNLIETIRHLWHHQDACLVEPMESCISASPLSHGVVRRQVF